MGLIWNNHTFFKHILTVLRQIANNDWLWKRANTDDKFNRWVLVKDIRLHLKDWKHVKKIIFKFDNDKNKFIHSLNHDKYSMKRYRGFNISFSLIAGVGQNNEIKHQIKKVISDCLGVVLKFWPNARFALLIKVVLIKKVNILRHFENLKF